MNEKILRGLLICNCSEGHKSKYKHFNFSDYLEMNKQVGCYLSEQSIYLHAQVPELNFKHHKKKKAFKTQFKMSVEFEIDF